jgi:predicted peptidase
MKWKFLVVALSSLLIAITAYSQDVYPKELTFQPGNTTITKTATAYPYLIYMPGMYCPDVDEQWPLIVFLHGSGERGSNPELVKKNGPPALIGDWEDSPFFLVSPQCPEGEVWDNERLMALVKEIRGKYHIDSTRMYLTGLSMGGYGTWNLASTYPGVFAAIAPVCGGGSRLLAHKLKDTPVWAFHGEEDNIVPPSESLRMTEAVNTAGGNAILTLYPGIGHNSWEPAYANTELYTWLLSHQLKTQKQ